MRRITCGVGPSTKRYKRSVANYYAATELVERQSLDLGSNSGAL